MRPLLLTARYAPSTAPGTALSLGSRTRTEAACVWPAAKTRDPGQADASLTVSGAPPFEKGRPLPGRACSGIPICPVRAAISCMQARRRLQEVLRSGARASLASLALRPVPAGSAVPAVSCEDGQVLKAWARHALATQSRSGPFRASGSQEAYARRQPLSRKLGPWPSRPLGWPGSVLLCWPGRPG